MGPLYELTHGSNLYDSYQDELNYSKVDFHQIHQLKCFSSFQTWDLSYRTFLKFILFFAGQCPLVFAIFKQDFWLAHRKLRKMIWLAYYDCESKLFLTWVFIFRLLRLGSFSSLLPSFSKLSLLKSFWNFFFFRTEINIIKNDFKNASMDGPQN